MLRLLSRILAIALLGIAIIAPAMAQKQNKIWYHDQVAVLMYHHVDDEAKSGATITLSLLEEQLDFLIAQGYNFITFEQFRLFLAGDSVPPNAVLVTYDDGYESFFTNAQPIHNARNIPAINFIITKFLDHPDSGYVRYMTREQLRQLSENSTLLSSQCHSHALHEKTSNQEPFLTARLDLGDGPETEEQYAARIKNDARYCRQYLQDVGQDKVDAYAYPYGSYHDQAIDLLRESGFLYAFTVEPGLATREINPYEIPRINAGAPWITPRGLHKSILQHIVSKVNHAPENRNF